MWNPKYHITHTILNNIRQIGEVLGEIKSLQLKNTTLSQIQYKARELSAYASTSIEGNPLSLTDVKRLLKNQLSAVRDTEKEILNYNAALDFIYTHVKSDTFSLSISTLEKVQSLIVNDLINDPSDCGKLRQKPVVIRDPSRPGSIVFIPPDVQDVRLLTKELCEFVTQNLRTMDPILLAGLFHKQFVIIHPFMDGNGRSTRLLTTAILGATGLNFFEIFSFENYYNQNVTQYFKKVGLYGDYYEQKANIDFTEWLEYFSGGILDELKRVQKSIPSINTQHRIPKHFEIVLNYLKDHGSISQSEYGEISTRSLAARKNDFSQMIQMKLIQSRGHGKGTYYVLHEEL